MLLSFRPGRALLLLLCVLLLFGVVSCAPEDQQTTEESEITDTGTDGTEEITDVAPLPDLIIESVEYIRIPNSSSGMEPEGIRLEYTVHIRNTGTADATGDIYYGYALRSSGDSFADEDYSSGGLLVGSATIGINEVVTATCIGSVGYNSTEPVSFWINPNGTRYENIIPYLEESDFSNNTFDLMISWPVQEKPVQPKPEPDVTVYVSSSTQYLETGEPRTYSAEELRERVVITNNSVDEVPDSAIDACLSFLSPCLYRFPGYEYSVAGDPYPKFSISLTVFDDAAGVLRLRCTARNILDRMADTSFRQDSYQVTFYYTKSTGECTPDGFHIFHYSIPEQVYNNAIALMKESPVYMDFVNLYGKPEVYPGEWFDGVTGPHTNYYQQLESLDFKKPVKGIVAFDLSGSGYHDLRVFVDMFNGEVITIGPYRNPPQ